MQSIVKDLALLSLVSSTFLLNSCTLFVGTISLVSDPSIVVKKFKIDQSNNSCDFLSVAQELNLPTLTAAQQAIQALGYSKESLEQALKLINQQITIDIPNPRFINQLFSHLFYQSAEKDYSKNSLISYQEGEQLRTSGYIVSKENLQIFKNAGYTVLFNGQAIDDSSRIHEVTQDYTLTFMDQQFSFILPKSAKSYIVIEFNSIDNIEKELRLYFRVSSVQKPHLTLKDLEFFYFDSYYSTGYSVLSAQDVVLGTTIGGCSYSYAQDRAKMFWPRDFIQYAGFKVEKVAKQDIKIKVKTFTFDPIFYKPR